MSTIDLKGDKFVRWTVIGESNPMVDKRGYKIRMYECQCECGSVRCISMGSLTSGNTKSCGCLRAESMGNRMRTHGMKGTATYSAWTNMMCRCTNKDHQQYSNYGGRGINVSDCWKSFANFLSDMGVRPKNMSIDRIDNNQGYSKENCRWATRYQQANNKRSNKFMEYSGESKTITQWARFFKINPRSLNSRIIRGWDMHDAISTPFH